MLRHLLFALAATMTTVAVAAPAFAQDDVQQTAAAMALHERAIAAMDAKDYATACPKLEEAIQLAPTAVGVRFALGECYEGLGRLASAWTAWAAAENAARRANQSNREKNAHERMEALRPQLARLRIVVSDRVKGLSGLTIQRDGVPVGPGQWNEPLPIDKGKHVIVAQAPGKKPIERTVDISADGSETPMNIPMLLDAEVSPNPPPTGVAPTAATLTPVTVLPPKPESDIRMDTDRPGVTLYRMTGIFAGTGHNAQGIVELDGVSGAPICELPCKPSWNDLNGHEFFFGGEGIPNSDRFRIRSPKPQTFQVSKGSHAMRFGGKLALMGGGLATFVGIAALSYSAILFDDSSPADTAAIKQTFIKITVLSFVGAGIGFGVGIPLLIGGRTTYVHLGPGAATVRF